MRRLAPLALLLAAGLLLTGCGSSDEPTATQTTQAPEEVTTDALTVANGLAKIRTTTANIVVSIADSAKATELDGQIEPVWATIEGTVKKNDPDTYIALEDAFAVLEEAAGNADATKAAAGASSVVAAVATYLARYPAS